MGSLYTAISGLQASSRWLDVISNNVSNSNTVGFKYSRVNFQDLVSQGLISASGPSTGSNLGGINPSQLGVGVTVASVQNILTQGTLQTTGNPTDVAISGTGYFTVKQGANTVYTRAGNFTFDNAGNLVTSGGGLVQGWSQTITRTLAAGPVLTGVTSSLSSSGQPGNIQIPQNLVLGPQATSLQLSQTIHDQGVQLKGNLDSKTPANAGFLAGAGAFPAGSVPDAIFTSTVYDSLGTAHEITYYAYQTAVTASPTNAQASWNFKIFDTTGGLVPDPTAATGNLLGDVTGVLFNGDGSLQFSGTGAAGSTTGGANTVATAVGNTWQISDFIKPANALGVTPLAFVFTVNIGVENLAGPPASLGDRSGLTGDFGNGTTNGTTGVYTPVQSVYTANVDGYSEGNLVGLGVDQTGVINCQFSNNQTVKMAQLALTQFSNPGGLTKVGSSDFAQTANSGFPQTGTAGSNGFGVIQGGALEQSNVDLSIELTNMLVAQKMFESNARVITTADKILDTLVNLGR